MGGEVDDDTPKAPRGLQRHDLRAYEMPNHDAVGALEAQEEVAVQERGAETASGVSEPEFSPFDHDRDGKPGAVSRRPSARERAPDHWGLLQGPVDHRGVPAKREPVPREEPQGLGGP